MGSPCLACQSRETKRYFIKNIKDRNYLIYKCFSCGTAFTWPRPNPADIERYYRQTSYHSLTLPEAVRSDERYHPNSRKDAQRIILNCRKLCRGDRFLDAGAGSGVFSKAALEHGFAATACEPNPNARMIFRAVTGFEAENSMFDDTYAGQHLDSFDVVLLSHVLEHTFDPESVTRNARRVLRPDGLAMIVVPHFGSALSRFQGKNDMFISPPEHLNYFSKRGLEALFERHGFRLLVLKTPSKIHKAKFAEMVRIPVVSGVVWRILYGALAFWNPLKLGMVINAYFRRI
jgi:SAM-dependent methyltransferase